MLNKSYFDSELVYALFDLDPMNNFPTNTISIMLISVIHFISPKRIGSKITDTTNVNNATVSASFKRLSIRSPPFINITIY